MKVSNSFIATVLLGLLLSFGLSAGPKLEDKHPDLKGTATVGLLGYFISTGMIQNAEDLGGVASALLSLDGHKKKTKTPVKDLLESRMVTKAQSWAEYLEDAIDAGKDPSSLAETFFSEFTAESMQYLRTAEKNKKSLETLKKEINVIEAHLKKSKETTKSTGRKQTTSTKTGPNRAGRRRDGSKVKQQVKVGSGLGQSIPSRYYTPGKYTPTKTDTYKASKIPAGVSSPELHKALENAIMHREANLQRSKSIHDQNVQALKRQIATEKAKLLVKGKSAGGSKNVQQSGAFPGVSKQPGSYPSVSKQPGSYPGASQPSRSFSGVSMDLKGSYSPSSNLRPAKSPVEAKMQTGRIGGGESKVSFDFDSDLYSTDFL